MNKKWRETKSSWTGLVGAHHNLHSVLMRVTWGKVNTRLIICGGMIQKNRGNNVAPPHSTLTLNQTHLSAFRTREDRQPTSKFVAACPCPDGLMQDGTQEGNEAYVISHRGACSRGYKRCEGARARASGGERERVPACLPVCPRRPTLSVLQRLSTTSNVCSRRPTCVFDVQHVFSTCLRKALDIPFNRYKEMPSCTRECSYVLSWLAEKRLEPCTRANVAVEEVP
jgi:hypothetical protein